MSNLVELKAQAFPSTDQWRNMHQAAKELVQSGFLPSAVNSPQKAVAIMLKGWELGIPAMQSFSQISVIKGKPCCGSEMQLALILRQQPKTSIRYLKMDREKCAIEVQRPGHPVQQFSYSIEEARQASLLGKDNWKNYPADMLRARCISRMARSLFPDCIAGMSHTPEELDPDIELDAEGQIVETQVVESKEVSRETTQPEPVDNFTEETPADFITQKQRARLFAIAKSKDWTVEQVKNVCKEGLGISSTKNLEKSYYEDLCNLIEAGRTPDQIIEELNFNG